VSAFAWVAVAPIKEAARIAVIKNVFRDLFIVLVILYS
jgi:hypothetical protein